MAHLGERPKPYHSVTTLNHVTLVNMKNHLMTPFPHPSYLIEDKILIGGGAFGDVYTEKRGKEFLARKVFKHYAEFEEEYAVFKKIKSTHPLVLRLLEASGPTKSPGELTFPLYPNFSLEYLIRNCRQPVMQPLLHYEFHDVLSWTIDMLTGITWLHRKWRMAHLDIKPDNIFLDQDFRAVIGDMGTCCDIGAISNRHPATPPFCPPEFRQLLDNKNTLPNGLGLVGANITGENSAKQTENYDTFSIGATVVALICLKNNEEYDFIDGVVYRGEGLWPSVQKIPAEFTSLLYKMITQDWVERATPNALLDDFGIRQLIQRFPKPEWAKVEFIYEAENKELEEAKDTTIEAKNQANASLQKNLDDVTGKYTETDKALKDEEKKHKTTLSSLLSIHQELFEQGKQRALKHETTSTTEVKLSYKPKASTSLQELGASSKKIKLEVKNESLPSPSKDIKFAELPMGIQENLKAFNAFNGITETRFELNCRLAEWKMNYPEESNPKLLPTDLSNYKDEITSKHEKYSKEEFVHFKILEEYVDYFKTCKFRPARVFAFYCARSQASIEEKVSAMRIAFNDFIIKKKA